MCLLDGLRGRPAQDVVGTPGLVIGACEGTAERAGDTTEGGRDRGDTRHRRDMRGWGHGGTQRDRRDMEGYER